MDSTDDDDFGELYVDDVKVPPSADDVRFVKSRDESEPTMISDDNKAIQVTMNSESLAKVSSPVNLTETTEESDYSDSDDDLNIVLEDDDSKVIPVACVSNLHTEASQTLGYNLSNTWTRTPFDVNLDMLEKKPWRDPGSDVSDFFNFGFNEQRWKDYCKPLGRAIEVRGGTHERISSVDVSRPRDSDPDVVIHIPVTDDVEELSTMKPVNASRSEEFHSDDGKDLSSSSDSVKEEASVGCQDENSGSFRDRDAQSPPIENLCSREVTLTPSDKEMIEEEKEESCWKSDEKDPSSTESESSLGDRIHFSPTSSYSVIKSEESEDSETESSKGGASDDHLSTPPRRNNRFSEQEENSIRGEERSGTKHSRDRRSHEDPIKREYGGAEYGVHKRTIHKSAKDTSPTPDPYLGKKVFSGCGSLYRDSSKNWMSKPRFPHSNRENRHGFSYSSVGLDRDRGHRFNMRNSNKESSRGRSFDHSNGYNYGEQSSFNLNLRSSQLSYKEEKDRYGRQPYERKYRRERSPDLAYEQNRERDGYDWPREPYPHDRYPITDMDYRYQQSRENDLDYRQRGDYSYNFKNHRYEDEVQQADSRIPFGLAYREIYPLPEVDEEFYEIDRRHHDTPNWHADRFVSENGGYNYRTQAAWPSQRDSWHTKRSRVDSWGVETRDFVTTEAYDSQTNRFYEID